LAPTFALTGRASALTAAATDSAAAAAVMIKIRLHIGVLPFSPVDEYPPDIAAADASSSSDGYGDGEEPRRAIDALPQGQRSAIELLKLREMSLKEASKATGISVGALKVSVHRAIKTLRASLQG